MRYGLFSDVHANYEAFGRVCEALKREKIDRYVFLGDIVGYGANPQECVWLLRDLVDHHGCLVIAGNHDYAVAGLADTDHYNSYAVEAIQWTAARLTPDDLAFLRDMPLVQRTDHFTIVHANLEAPDQWGYVLDIDDADSTFQLMKDAVCFIGHSHRPVVFTAGQSVDWSVKDRIEIRDQVRYIINIGSVGQPRDGNPRAAYAVYDTERRRVEIKRVAYDIERAQQKIIAAGLPRLLAERLSHGK